ncbi:expressed unknown protein [Seminavis robusta]|uniref:Uncharacterized protein n=1 Tax=Seminavis robusta TaxID=568900 RepID=A0A9N8HCX1_9STRA|nr:expressed unknown protein [Seminavis robusta]|eukprot:Sro236_g095050.1 n/a (1214) ;mRNA; f:59706-63435
MTFPGRRMSLGRSSGSREGKESLLLKPEPSVYSSGSNSSRRSRQNRYQQHDTPSFQSGSSYSSGGSDPYEKAVRSEIKSKQHAHEQQSRPSDGVMEFVPAFDESNAHGYVPDTSWDAILNEGSTAFPGEPAKSRSDAGALTNSRFRRRAQSTVGKPQQPAATNSRRHSDAASAVSSSRSKGPRIARLASLFSGKESKSKASPKQTNLSSYSQNSYTPHNTTEPTLASSPSRSSSSSGYVGWPGTQDKQGHTVAMHDSYEDSDPGPIDQAARGEDLSFGEFHNDREQMEVDEWMNSSAFQDISGVMPEQDVSGIMPESPPSPPGRRPDNSYYYHPEQQQLHTETNAIHTNHLFHDQGGWDVDTAPSPSRSSFSKNSSAYFDNDVRPTVPSNEDARRKQAAAVVMRGVLPPTEETLALNNCYSQPQRTFHAEHARGFRGFIDKTHEVPNLMDDMDSDSMASSSQTSSRAPSAANIPAAYHSSANVGRAPRVMPRVHEDEELSVDSESDVFDEISKYSLGESELFDGLSSHQSVSKQSGYEIRDLHPYEGIPRNDVEESKASLREIRNTTTSVEKRYKVNDRSVQSNGSSKMKVVLLGGGLTTIQTTTEDFSNRITASDFDDGLTNSDIDEYGHPRLPNFQEMAAAGRTNDSAIDVSIAFGHSNVSKDASSLSFTAFEEKNSQLNEPEGRTLNPSGSYKDDESAFFSDFYSADDVEFEGDLSEYYVQPSEVKKLVRKYRKMCRITASQCRNYDELDRAEDEKKAFALFEMRSRIMEKDIERGLERRGGTSAVDDLVTTPFNRRAMRIRDAVIVSKAWRDGATPMDVINTALLTQRAERSYFIKRTSRVTSYRMPDANLHVEWEAVNWIDDTDFLQYYCPSLGARNLRGSEMFTIGDCQSILLKLTNESCIELRADLNDATARQIEAEEAMKEEGDYGDGMMTEAEMTYLASMEEVKTISKQLVVAEKAFVLVRDRIKNLVAKYESLLVKIDNEDMATSSVITAESSCYSDEYESRVSTDYDQEERAWFRRQQRAEISAELAAREALLAKQGEARAVQEEKHRELQALQTRLVELQSEASTTTSDRQRSAMLAKAIAARNHSSRKHPGHHHPVGKATPQSKVDDVKQRFRDRMAARLRQKNGTVDQSRADFEPQGAPSNQRYHMENELPSKPVTSARTTDPDRQKMIRSAGEEMFQHLDFYERSLKAVELSREGPNR